jgi:membrane protein implicated in regulation of membrane protease activity
LSSKRENAAIVGVGAVACAACCAGPIIGFFGALGLFAGVALFGSIGFAVAALVLLILVRRRRRRAQACAPTSGTRSPVKVEITSTQNRR